MYKLLPAIVFLFLFCACSRKPYADHKVSLEKKADDCTALQNNFQMLSNIGGERFEFEKCLPADYDKDQLTSTRQGDTVLVHFSPKEPASEKALFQVTLDIDSYPSYRFITIDGETYAITATQN